MEIVTRLGQMAAISKRAIGEPLRIGLVPTMGALHAGHLSLVRRSKEMADLTVVSIFVNPTQFGPQEDFARYPRNLAHDLDSLTPEGVDYVFTPTVEELYPPGFSTGVLVEGLSDKLCGASRPGHFRGVATIVAKLLHIIRPTFLFLGQKDAQQVVIIQRMLQDLNIDTELVVCPIVRDADGLALSSRNSYLSTEERLAARVLHRALEAAALMIRSGERQSHRIHKSMRDLIRGEPRATIDYVAIADRYTLEPVSYIDRDVLIALAVFIGKTRLIDNQILSIAA